MTSKKTKIIEAGRRKEWTHGVVNPPVYHASTVLFERYGDIKKAAADRANNLYYGRMGTPTVWALQEAVAELEGGAGARVYPSGMAAVSAACLSVLGAGDHMLVADHVYDPTRKLCDKFLKRFGVEVTYFDPMIGAEIADLFQPNTKVVFTESPGSLTFEVMDIPAIAKVAHDKGALVLMDNTWGTPLLFEAFKHGVDLSIHAATKYIVGHSDAMLGIVVANEKTLPQLSDTTLTLGLSTGPDDVFLGLRGLRTLDVRLKQHEKNALKVAKWLKDHPLVDRVLHPALPDCPGHEIWKRDFEGSSGLFSIVLNAGSMKNIGVLVDDLEHFGIGFSWGGYESLALPVDPTSIRTATHWEVKGPVVRLHIGLEDPDDLIQDLEKGLARFQATIEG